VIGILAALYQRAVTGEGQRVEVAMQDVMINFIRPAFGRQLVTGKATERVGNDQPMAPVAPNGIYPCKPGGPNDYVFIYTSRWPGSKQWEQLLDVIGCPEMKSDPRFATPESRYEHREEMNPRISDWTCKRTKFEAMEELGRAGVPAGAILTTAELAADPYLRQRGMFVTMQHPVRGPIVMPGFPIMLSASSVPIEPAPLLGQHNVEIYRGMLGLSEDELERLRQARVI
jgi:formyl-CoA transferase